MKQLSLWLPWFLLVAIAMSSCDSRQIKGARTAAQYETAVVLIEEEIKLNGGSATAYRVLVEAKWKLANRLLRDEKILQCAAMMESVIGVIDQIDDTKIPKRAWYHSQYEVAKRQADTVRIALQPAPPEQGLLKLRQLASVYKGSRNEPEIQDALSRLLEPTFSRYAMEMTVALADENHERAKEIYNELLFGEQDVGDSVYSLLSPALKARSQEFRDTIVALKTAHERVVEVLREGKAERRFSTIASISSAIDGVSVYVTGKKILEEQWLQLEHESRKASPTLAISLVRDALPYFGKPFFGERGIRITQQLTLITNPYFIELAAQAQAKELSALRYAALSQVSAKENDPSVLTVQDVAFMSEVDQKEPSRAHWRLAVAWNGSPLLPITLPETLTGVLASKQRLAGLVSTRFSADSDVTVDASALTMLLVEPNPAMVRRQTGQFLAGTREVVNPVAVTLQRNANEIDREIQRLNIECRFEAQRPLKQGELINGRLLGLATTRNQRINEYNQVMNKLSQTSATLMKPIYESYQFNEWPQEVGYAARGWLTVTIKGKAYQEAIDVKDSKTCVVVDGVHPDDAARRQNIPSTLPSSKLFWATGSRTLVDALAAAIAQAMRKHAESIIIGDLAALEKSVLESWYGAGRPAEFTTNFIYDPIPPKIWESLFVPESVVAGRPVVHLQPAATGTKPLTASEAYKQSVAAITVVFSNDGHGTGFILSPEGLMMTNAHVVGDLNIVAVRGNYADGRVFGLSGAVIAKDVQKDIALVMLRGLEGPLRTVRLQESADIDPGADVIVIGNPGVTEEKISLNNITKGIVSNPRLVIPQHGRLILLDAAVNPGNSGGPCIDLKTGEVIGMVTYGFSRSPELNTMIHEGQGGAVPSDILLEFLRANAQIAPSVPQSP